MTRTKQCLMFVLIQLHFCRRVTKLYVSRLACALKSNYEDRIISLDGLPLPPQCSAAVCGKAFHLARRVVGCSDQWIYRSRSFVPPIVAISLAPSLAYSGSPASSVVAMVFTCGQSPRE